MQVTLEDIEVMYTTAENGLAGMKDAWNRVESPLSNFKGRRFYGTFLNGEYRACVALQAGDDPAALGLGTWTIPGGTYARGKIDNWPERTSEISEMVAALAEANAVDPSRPTIEFYRSQRELILYMPIQAKP